ncbi:MAG: ABC transporter substrate-binding protein [Deltaproteobacteria bacterium]|nr:ABC transporter substrate-binding protein [Deltaproteobacteria bacterium]
MERIKVGHDTFAATKAPLWLAHDLGLFSKHGLEVELTHAAIDQKLRVAEVEVPVINVEMGGDVPIIVCGGVPTFTARLWEALLYDVVSLACTEHTVHHQLVTVPSARRLGDLRGKRVGVTRFGNMTEYIVRVLARRADLDPDRDLVLLYLGGSEMTGLEALKRGRLDACLLREPHASEARALRFTSPVDVPALQIPIYGSGVTTTRSFLGRQPAIVEAFLKGFLEGTAIFLQDEARSLEVMARHMALGPSELQRAYREVRTFLPRKPFPSIEGTRLALEVFRRPALPALDPEAFIDPEPLRRLDASGFIDALYAGPEN